MNTVIIGSGFDIDLGLKNSFSDFAKSHRSILCGNDLWSDFEKKLQDKVVEWYNNGMDDNEAIDLNRLWCAQRNNLSYFFTEQSDKFSIDKGRCAYQFLESLTRKSKKYTFNYTIPYDYVQTSVRQSIIHLHGIHYRDTFKKPMMVMSQGNELVLGIDENCIPKEGMQNKYISALCKKNQKGYATTNIVNDLTNSEIVIMFGFSVNVVDFSYFKQLFEEIEKGISVCKRIIYITGTEDHFERFVSNLKNNGVQYDILSHNVCVQPYYTIKGHQTKEFSEILRLL